MSEVLSYVGGKTRAIKLLTPMFPPGKVEVAAPFLGGGAVEIELERKGYRVHGADTWKPLVDYWNILLSRPLELADKIMDYFPFQEAWRGGVFQSFYEEAEDDLTRAAIFYVISKVCYSARFWRATESSLEHIHQKGLTLTGINRLGRFRAPGLSVELADFKDFIPRHPDHFVFADPPYPGREWLYNLPTHHITADKPKHFDHQGLASLLRGRGNWILTYGEDPMIRDLYGWADVQPARWQYGIASERRAEDKKDGGRELIIRPREQPKWERGLFAA